MTFDEYYKHTYLPAHSRKSTKMLHMAGVVATLGWIALAISQSFVVGALMLAISPFIVYPFAWSAHAFFEKNRPLAFNNPVWAKLADLRMCKEILTGELRL